MDFDQILLSIAGGLIIIIGSLIAFVVARFIGNITDVKTELKEFRIDIIKELKNMNESLNIIDRDLRDRIFGIDKRVIKMETEFKRRSEDGK